MRIEWTQLLEQLVSLLEMPADCLLVVGRIAEPVPEVGVGRAINDRLRRAAATWH